MLPVFGTTIVSTTSHHRDMQDGMGDEGPCGGRRSGTTEFGRVMPNSFMSEEACAVVMVKLDCAAMNGGAPAQRSGRWPHPNCE